MAEEALGEEYSGRHLALLLWGTALRRLIWLSLVADLALPFGLGEATGSPLGWLVGAWPGRQKLGADAGAGAVAGRRARRGRGGSAEACGIALLLGGLAVAFLFAAQGLA